MITLITGEPGSGKTAYVVDLLQKSSEGLNVFVMGIPDLLIPHEVVPQINDWTVSEPVPEDPTIYQDKFAFPDGSLVVIDEAQKVYRNRPTSSRVPPIVSAFETHRHQGLNFILITQHPGLIDSHVRKLVGRHIHVTANWAGRKLYEWSSCGEPRDKSSVAEAIARPYRLPRHVFGLYRSASKHTAVKRRVPMSAYAVGIMLLMVPALSWYAFSRVRAHVEPEQGSQPVSSPSSSGVKYAAKSDVPLTAVAMAESFMPRIKTRPETAPIYDPIRKVSSMPVVVGCLQSAKSCMCYTDQATDAFLTREQCQEWLKHPPYNPWRVVDSRRDREDSRGERPARAAVDEIPKGKGT